MSPDTAPSPTRHRTGRGRKLLGGVAFLFLFAVYLSFGFGGEEEVEHTTGPERIKGDQTQQQHHHTDTPDEKPTPNTPCRVLQTTKGFSATLCWDAKRCSGNLSVSRDCLTPISDRKISEDLEFDDWVKRRLGPDHYRLLFKSESGVAQRELHYQGKCGYSTGEVHLLGKGPHYLAVELLYQNYEAIDETKNIWPPLLKTPVLPHGEQARSETEQTAWHFGQLTPPSDQFVMCDGTDHTPSANSPEGLFAFPTSRWAVKPDGVLYTKVRVKKIVRKPIVFNWTRQAHPEYYWEEIQGSGRVENGVDQCITDFKAKARRGMNAFVTGDSQLRALYFGLVNILKGGGEACVRNISSPSHKDQYLFPESKLCVENVKGSHKHRFGALQTEFVDDPYLGACHKAIGGAHGVVILGFGQHPASRKHWSFKRFESTLKERLGCVSQMMGKGKTVVWVMAPKYPDTQTGFPVGVMDWRTDLRLLLFNNAARKGLQKLQQTQSSGKLRVVEAFDMSAPLGHTSSDQAHYNNVVLHNIASGSLQGICDT